MRILALLCFITAVVFFALVGFGVEAGNPHFALLPLGLALVALGLAVERLPVAAAA